jgi:ferritin-like metal-binding protein YciE
MSALVPVEQKQVVFYDDELTAVQADNGRIYVAVTQMCNVLGLDARNQRRRIQDHTILSEGYTRGVIYAPPSADGRGGGEQEAGLLRVDLIPLWLAGIRLNRVHEDVRSKLEKYQREAAAVLWEAFQEGRLTADPILGDLLQSNTEAVQAYKMLQALVKLARNQILLEAQLGTHTTQLADHEQRLEEIESSLGDTGRNVTPDQASQISQAVKAVAIALGKQTKRNEFGAVYGELYRKFGITSYKLLPANRFEAAMKLLTVWHQDLVGDVPF